ncbi:hypothetical protein BGZ89_011750 [Linnemannia elongata]|nr:hypothetical protein BGZ89_011750 [Linnemannia elongata]
MRVPLHLLRQLKTIAWLWGTLSLLAPLASAQAPALVCCMAYTTINENTFFIQGGLLITGPGISSNTSQFYSLDLTQPTWNTLNPPWKPLTYPATLVPLASTAGHSMSVAQDNSGFTMWMASNLVATYNIGSNSWGQIVPTPPATLFKGSNLQAATDPTSGLVYLPGAAGTPNSMSVFSSSTGMSLSVPMPPTLVAAGAFYSFVWSKVRKTFIYYGGNAATPNPFFEFSPSAGKWTSMPIAGSVIPPFQMRSCMVSAYNGTKILLFGGNTDTTPSVDTLYILDVPTMIWTQVDNSLDARSDMACSVSGDNFIVWGGYKRFPGNPFLPASATPLIYNMYLGKWTTTYTRGSNPPPPVTTGTGKPNPSPTGKDDSNNKDGGGGGSNGAAIGASYYPPPPPLSPPPPTTSSHTISKEALDHVRQLELQIALGEKQLANAGSQYNKSSNNPQYNPGYSEIQPMSPVRGPQGSGIPVLPEPTSSADHRELARKIEIMHAELQSLQSQLKL